MREPGKLLVFRVLFVYVRSSLWILYFVMSVIAGMPLLEFEYRVIISSISHHAV